jgi:membrane protease subunit (stomatin/prohibitin family)
MAIIDRVKYDGPDDVFIWRWPGDALVWGTQVIVNQTQEAILLKDGKIVDTLPPGVHTLKTANIPILKSLVNIPFGNETPFAAEIYYVNKSINMALKWGTREPIPIQEPQFNLFVPVRAFGRFGMKVADGTKLVTTLVGTMPLFDSSHVLDYFQGHLMSHIKDYIAEKLVNDKISVLTITAHLNEISSALKEKVAGEFARFGLDIVNFYLESISVPPEDDTVKRLKKMLADKAEFDVLGDNRYKTLRTFDTMQAAAGNEGGAGGMMGMGVGMGMGMGAGAGMGQMMGQAIGAQTAQVACPACNGTNPAGSKFCGQCGKPMGGGLPCPKCQKPVPGDAKFCPSCGNPMGEKACGKCNTPIAAGSKFCPSCGQAAG